MHNRDFNQGMGHGDWSWLPMTIGMVLLLGALLWIGLTLARRGHTAPALHTAGGPPPMPPRPSAQEVLADRLARGEIEPDDYRRRMEALQPPTVG